MPWACSSRFFLKHLRRDSIVRAAPNAALGPRRVGTAAQALSFREVACAKLWNVIQVGMKMMMTIFLYTIGLRSVLTKKHLALGNMTCLTSE